MGAVSSIMHSGENEVSILLLYPVGFRFFFFDLVEMRRGRGGCDLHLWGNPGDTPSMTLIRSIRYVGG